MTSNRHESTTVGAASSAARYLIVNADDFGASDGINRGIIDVHRSGFLTSTSLMVTQPAAEAAAALADENPDLSIGMHTDLTGEGGPARIDVDDPTAAARELAEQLARFHELLNRSPSHLDAHHNLHRHPPLTAVFIDAAAELQIPLRENCPVRYFPDFYAQWDEEIHPEQVSPENLRRMLLEEVGPGITELSCHPGYHDPDFESVYHIERRIELDTLIDPELPRFAADNDINLINYDQARDLLAGLGWPQSSPDGDGT